MVIMERPMLMFVRVAADTIILSYSCAVKTTPTKRCTLIMPSNVKLNRASVGTVSIMRNCGVS